MRIYAIATCLSSSSDLVCSSAGGLIACLSYNISTDGPDDICIHTDQGNSNFGEAECRARSFAGDDVELCATARCVVWCVMVRSVTAKI